MKTFRNFYLGSAAAMMLGSCAPATDQAKPGAAESKTTLIVENRNWAEMVIYVLRGSVRSRLGSVSSMQTATFRISEAMVGGTGDLRIIADPIGSNRTYTSPMIYLVPGSQIELTVENQISISSFAVY